MLLGYVGFYLKIQEIFSLEEMIEDFYYILCFPHEKFLKIHGKSSK